jgi:hypothetical protein
VTTIDNKATTVVNSKGLTCSGISVSWNNTIIPLTVMDVPDRLSLTLRIDAHSGCDDAPGLIWSMRPEASQLGNVAYFVY